MNNFGCRALKRWPAAIVLFATYCGGFGWAADGAADLPSLLKRPINPLFSIERKAGKYAIGDPESYFAGNSDYGKLTFDISSNTMLANHGAQGELNAVTTYRDTYFTLTPAWPGVWTAKDNTTSGPYSFSIEVAGKTYDLAKVPWDFQTGLIDNLIPVTRMVTSNGALVMRIVTFSPMSADGALRPRGLIYGLSIENASAATVNLKVVLPNCNAGKKPYDQWAQSDKYSLPDMMLTDGRAYASRVPVTLEAGKSDWIGVLLYVPGEGVAEAIGAHPAAWWLEQTLAYYRRLLGRLEIPAHPYVASFYERELMQSLQCIGMSGQGKMVGSNWGSVSATRMIWTKDCYYSGLPLVSADPDFGVKIVAWFDAFGVRPSGVHNRADEEPKTARPSGGLSHSISLAVAAPLMASRLYEVTADPAPFLAHPGWKAHWAEILEGIVASRVEKDVYLFPTQFISDGPVRGDYHAGSNICVWRALVGYARLLEEVWKDPAGAARYREIAEKVKAAILSRAKIDGPYGSQFIEVVNRDGQVLAMISDGEESDTTLAPFYGFMSIDDPIYRNTMRFAASEHNKLWTPALHAIGWEGTVPSTSPGYNKAVAAANDAEGLFGPHGAYTEFQRVTDADGSVWWWTYGSEKTPDPKKPTRSSGGIGKAGWTAGVHSTLMPTNLLGLRYDAPTRRLAFAPRDLLGAFTWIDFPIGRDRFSVGYDPATHHAWVENRTDHELTVELTLAGGKQEAALRPSERKSLQANR